MHHELHRANYMVDHGGHDSMMYAPGPLTRAMRVLRRVSTLLEEPAPVVSAEPDRWRAGGVLGPGLFADGSGKDLLMDMDEEDAAFDAARHSVHIPTLGEEWVGLLDRTFLLLRGALQHRQDTRGVYEDYESPDAPTMTMRGVQTVLEDRLYAIACSLNDISHSIQMLQAKHAPRAVWNPWPNEMQPTDGRRVRTPAAAVEPDLAEELAELRAAMEKLTALVRADGDVSPPAPSDGPSNEPDDGPDAPDLFDPDDL